MVLASFELRHKLVVRQCVVEAQDPTEKGGPLDLCSCNYSLVPALLAGCTNAGLVRGISTFRVKQTRRKSQIFHISSQAVLETFPSFSGLSSPKTFII